MNKVYFVFQDETAPARQSDGVEMCVIPDLFDEKIYFYCSEYSVFWREIEDVGNFDKVFNFKSKSEIRPALLSEISDAGLCGYVSTVKEYKIEAGKIKEINYIHLSV
ncbi:MAG: hypothetical protein U1F46_00025 [Marinagarivorans sp.]